MIVAGTDLSHHRLGTVSRDLDNRCLGAIVSENIDVMKNADYIIDLGPGAGDRGGQIIATGTPEEVAGQDGSATGHYLKRSFSGIGRLALTSG